MGILAVIIVVGHGEMACPVERMKGQLVCLYGLTMTKDEVQQLKVGDSIYYTYSTARYGYETETLIEKVVVKIESDGWKGRIWHCLIVYINLSPEHLWTIQKHSASSLLMYSLKGGKKKGEDDG